MASTDRTRSATIALVGLRCAGKTSVGRELARGLGLPFVDLDDELVRLHAGSTRVGELLVELGEPAFRALEQRALETTLAAGPQVLATGGGVVERASNRALLRERATCVWLAVEPDELARRLRADPTPRPALLGDDAALEVRALLARRAPWYAEVATLRIDGGALAPRALADRIRRRLDANERRDENE